MTRRPGKACAICGLGALALALAVPPRAAAQRLAEPEVWRPMLWSLIPGGGHFSLGEPEAGIAYAVTTFGLTGAGAWLDERNLALDREDEVNTLSLLGSKAWELSWFTTYRSALEHAGYDLAAEGVDDTPVGGLVLSPFRWRNVSKPMVLLAAALGAAAAALDAQDADHDYADIDRVGIFGGDANRDWGGVLYGASAFGLSMGAAVSEEAVWRGILQNELDKAYGETWALVEASVLFGAAHILDLNGEVRPERMVVPTLAGFYLGHMFERSEHRLGPPIAAHFWYNFALMATSFAMDPEDNPLGVQVSFGF